MGLRRVAKNLCVGNSFLDLFCFVCIMQMKELPALSFRIEICDPRSKKQHFGLRFLDLSQKVGSGIFSLQLFRARREDTTAALNKSRR